MPIIKDPHLFNEQSLFADLGGVLGSRFYLKAEGFNFAGSIFMRGGSTEAVVHGAAPWPADHDAKDLTGVAVCPDMGRPYPDSIYNPDWVHDHFRAAALATAGLAGAPGRRPEPVRELQHPARVPMAADVATAAPGSF